jgi:peptidoglycan/xylan/chitin deacetylase (PgdA/CDA1 family)
MNRRRTLLCSLAAVILVLPGRQDASASTISSHEVKRGRRGNRFIAITFDGGGNVGATRLILDILDEKRVSCTIFLTGMFIRKYPALVLRMVGDGHEIGNHTYSHPHLTTWNANRRHDTRSGITREFLHHQLRRTEREFSKLTGDYLSKFWRAPYGERNAQIIEWASEVGYVHVLWTSSKRGTLDCLDWVSDPSSKLYLSSLEIKEKILSFPDLDGAVILMHLGSERPHDPVYTKLPEIIDELRGRGYEFVPVSKLLEGS